MAYFLKCTPSEVMEMPHSDHDLLLRYWSEEPWGPYRDNMHAAIVAIEVRRTLTPKSKINFEDFMITHPRRRAVAKKRAFIDSLKAMAGGNRVHVSEMNERKKKLRRKRKQKDTGSKK